MSLNLPIRRRVAAVLAAGLRRASPSRDLGKVRARIRQRGGCRGAGSAKQATAGCNGAGVALGTALGGLLADLALGADSALLRDAQALPRPGWLPAVEPILRLGVGTVLRLMAVRSRDEI